jgi:putative DNA primase/helicase
LRWGCFWAAWGRIFPVGADKRPLTRHGFKDGTSDIAIITAWTQDWPYCDWGWEVTRDSVVCDVDRKHGKDGFRTFRNLAGCDPRDIDTPRVTTPSGGLHLHFDSGGQLYRNTTSLLGPGVDTRAPGGYVVLPTYRNGRAPERSLFGPKAPAPAWMAPALKRETADLRLVSSRPAPSPLFHSPHPTPGRELSEKEQKQARAAALAMLDIACAKIVCAPNGQQDVTRYKACHLIGGWVGAGYLDEKFAYDKLLAAALAMPTHGKPWRNLDLRVLNSLREGEGRPLAPEEWSQVLKREREP